MSPLQRLIALKTDSGASSVELAGILGVDERTLRRWLASEIDIPESRARWLERLIALEMTRARIVVTLER